MQVWSAKVIESDVCKCSVRSFGSNFLGSAGTMEDNSNRLVEKYQTGFIKKIRSCSYSCCLSPVH